MYWVEFSPQRLTLMRKAAGLSKVELASRIGKTSEILRLYERGEKRPSAETWEKLQGELSEPQELPPKYIFQTGHRYRIEDGVRCGQAHKNYRAQDKIEYVFEYEKKSGIHHFFREVSGGWTRTYTDVQLMGKRIKEVIE